MLSAACAQTTSGLATVEVAGGPQKVALQADNYEFTPNRVGVAVGRPVQVEVTNVSDATHSITVLSPKGQKLATADLPPQATRRVTFTPAEPGRYEFYCDKFGHSTLGMKGEFVAEGTSQEAAPAESAPQEAPREVPPEAAPAEVR